jgi:arylsulfatase B
MIKRFAVFFVVLWGLIQPALAANGNILVILADDVGIDVSTFYRTSVRFPTSPAMPAQPELLALANQGVVFTKHWATPWCSPTRASIMTGRYGFRHGLGVPIDQSTPQVILPTSALVLPEIVGTSSRNYVMRHIGKWHLSEGTNDPHVYGWTTWTGPNPGAGGPAKTGTGSPDYTDWRKYTGGAGGSTNALTTKYAMTDQVDEAISTINSANTANRRYFIWMGINSLHSPFHAPPSSLYTISLPGSPTVKDYFKAMSQAMDKELGRLLDSVNLATTTVIYLGDNASPTNVVESPYTASRTKGTIYGAHTPLIIAGEAVTARGYNTALVNCVDLFPTIIELAGLNPATAVSSSIDIDGVTLMPYLTNRTHPNPRAWAYAEVFDQGWNGPGWERTIRNQTFQLVERQNGTREFYNITNDPLQATNILSRTRTTTEAANLTELDAQLDDLIATR